MSQRTMPPSTNEIPYHIYKSELTFILVSGQGGWCLLSGLQCLLTLAMVSPAPSLTRLCWCRAAAVEETIFRGEEYVNSHIFYILIFLIVQKYLFFSDKSILFFANLRCLW